MSKTTRIIATAIPGFKPLEKDKDDNGDKVELTLSVSLSPQLTMRGENVQLQRHYEEIYNWPNYAAFFRNAIRIKLQEFKGGIFREIECDFKYEPLGNNMVEKESLTLWQLMFPANTPISNWEGTTIPYQISDLLQGKDIKKRKEKALDRCIENADIYAATRSDISGAILESFISELEDLKEMSVEMLLIHPLLTNGKNPLLNELYVELENILVDYKKELVDLALELKLTEVYDRNLAETTEFHKRFSAYSQHPELLRRTGWLWDYMVTLSKADIKRLQGKEQIFLSIDGANFNLYDPQSGETNHIQDATLNKIMNDDNSKDVDFWLSFINEIDIKLPLTAIRFDLNTATSNNIWNIQTLDGVENSIFSNFSNYVTVRNEHFTVSANLIDRNQLFQKIGDTLRKKEVDARVSTTATLNNDPATSVHLPNTANGYKANGITLVIDKLASILQKAINNDPYAKSREIIIKTTTDQNTDKKSILDNTAVIYQHNVHQGYRVDVISIDETKKTFSIEDFHYGSLCKKTETYVPIPSTNDENPHKIGESAPIEGWVSESAQIGNSGNLFVDQELFRWNDWSLVTSLDGDYQDEYSADHKLDIKTNTVENSLVPLRYFWKYSFALRPADICGNSQPAIDILITDKYKKELMRHCQEYDPGAESAKIFTEPIQYQRVDGMHAPRIFYYQDNNRNWHNEIAKIEKDLSRGELTEKVDNNEHLTTLVIRSTFNSDNNTLTYEGDDNDDIRVIAPPRVSLSFAIQHSVLDRLMQNAGDEADAILDKWVEMDEMDTYPQDIKNNINKNVARVSKNDNIDYLYDPLVNGFEFVLDNNTYELQAGYAFKSESTSNDPYWHNQKYHLVRLTEKADEKGKEASIDFVYNANTKQSETNIHLKQGATHQLLLGSKWGDEFLTKKPYDIFLPGVTKNMHTVLEVIHAVEKPCLLNTKFDNEKGLNFLNEIACSEKGLKNRFAGSTACEFQRLKFKKFPILTTGKYSLYIQYYDIVCDRTTDIGYRAVYTEKLVKSGMSPADLTSEENVEFRDTLHNLPDKRYYQANYYIEAVSAFSNYFQSNGVRSNSVLGFTSYKPFKSTTDPDKVFFEHPEQNEKQLKEFFPTSDLLKLSSTSKPKDLVIEKIVPLLEWHIEKDIVERTCNTFRVYFEGDWYSTGDEEKVALFFINDSGFSSANSLKFFDANDKVGNSICHLITQLGTDPISTIQGNIMPLDQQHFLSNRQYSDQNSVLIRDLEYDIPAFASELPNDISKYSLHFITYPIQFVSSNKLNEGQLYSQNFTEGRFYIDISIDNEILKNHYSPMVRFALARYQENSVSQKYCFSKINMTDFCPILPYRQLTLPSEGNPKITWNAQNSLRRVNDNSKNNKVYVFEEPDLENSQTIATRKIHIDVFRQDDFLLCDINLEKSGTVVASQEINGNAIKLETAGKNWTIAEYEFHNNDGISGDEDPNPRDEIRRRMVFFYTHIAKD